MFIVTLTEALGVLAALLLLLFVAIVELRKFIKQKRCTHDKYWENGQCHAICSGCGKHLGFIGSVRKERQKRQEVLHRNSISG